MRINLGAGRVILPVTPETQYGHLAPMPPGCFEPGWINIDKYMNPGIGELINLFSFPWIRSSNGNPFNDNSVDEIYCSHFAEHIPHKVELSKGLPQSLLTYRDLINDYDGWFVFFYECWRILKPGGIMNVIVPYGQSSAAMGDPTHTRYILPMTFTYFIPNPEAPFDYHLPFQFKTDDLPLLRFTNYGVEYNQLGESVAKRAMDTQYNVVDELRVKLVAVKDET